MKRVLLFLIASVCACGATGATITDTITDPSGTPLSGVCSIQASMPFTGAGGTRVAAEPVRVSFTNGAFSVTLVPTDTGTPSGQRYRVTCQTATRNWSELWAVPTSALPLKISQVVTISQASSGGIGTCAAHQFAIQTTVGGVVCAQPIIADITGLQTALDAKAATGHTHSSLRKPDDSGDVVTCDAGGRCVVGSPSPMPEDAPEGSLNVKVLYVDGTPGGGGGGGGSTDATISISDITTNNASTAKHGWMPKLPNDATKFFNGIGAWAVPPGAGGGSWGTIGGSMSAQTDLYNALGGKQATISGAPATWPANFLPSAHATSHASNGSDRITPAAIGAVDPSASYTDPSWLSLSWGGGRISGIPSTFAPTAHATSHRSNGSDPLTPDNIGAVDATALYTDPAWLSLTWGGGRLTGIPATFTPSAHAAAHASGGSDPVTPAAIGAFPARTMQSTAGGALAWTNGDGAAGNPTPALVFPQYIGVVAAKCQAGAAGIAFSYGATSAPTAVCITGSNTNFGVAEFTATGQYVQDRFRLPADQTGNVDFYIRTRAVATTGNQVWALQTTCVADNETADPAFNTGQNITIATAASTLRWTSGTQTGVTITGCSAGEELFWKLTLDASTTTTGNIDLIEVGWTVRRTL